MTTKKTLTRILLVLSGISVIAGFGMIFFVGNNINWKQSLENDKAIAIAPANTPTGISSGYKKIILLASPGTCQFEKPGSLVDPTTLPTGRVKFGTYQSPPKRSDLSGIQRDGKVWTWAWVASPATTKQPKVTCSSEYLVMNYPLGPFWNGIRIGYMLIFTAFILFITAIIMNRKARTSNSAAATPISRRFSKK